MPPAAKRFSKEMLWMTALVVTSVGCATVRTGGTYDQVTVTGKEERVRHARTTWQNTASLDGPSRLKGLVQPMKHCVKETWETGIVRTYEERTAEYNGWYAGGALAAGGAGAALILGSDGLGSDTSKMISAGWVTVALAGVVGITAVVQGFRALDSKRQERAHEKLVHTGDEYECDVVPATLQMLTLHLKGMSARVSLSAWSFDLELSSLLDCRDIVLTRIAPASASIEISMSPPSAMGHELEDGRIGVAAEPFVQWCYKAALGKARDDGDEQALVAIGESATVGKWAAFEELDRRAILACMQSVTPEPCAQYVKTCRLCVSRGAAQARVKLLTSQAWEARYRETLANKNPDWDSLLAYARGCRDLDCPSIASAVKKLDVLAASDAERLKSLVDGCDATGACPAAAVSRVRKRLEQVVKREQAADAAKRRVDENRRRSYVSRRVGAGRRSCTGVSFDYTVYRKNWCGPSGPGNGFEATIRNRTRAAKDVRVAWQRANESVESRTLFVRPQDRGFLKLEPNCEDASIWKVWLDGCD